jgi:hypothetical protein
MRERGTSELVLKLCARASAEQERVNDDPEYRRVKVRRTPYAMRQSESRYSFPAWTQLRFGTVFAGVTVCSLVLALVAQHHRHAELEAALVARDTEREELYKELMSGESEFHKATLARTRMGFSEVTLAVLADPTTIERLEILPHSGKAGTEETKRLTGNTVIVYSTRPTGDRLSRDFATGLATILMDTNTYLMNGELVTFDDFPQPQFGFRLQKGSSRLDLLFSLENSDHSSHVDLFVQTWTDRGELVESRGMGSRCLFQTTLAKMISPYKL